MASLSVTGLRSGYGTMQVLHEVDVEISDREIVALVGPNGAGKTTLGRAIFRLIPTSAGEIEFDGHDLTRLTSHRLAALGMAYVPQEGNTFPQLTVEENLHVSLASVARGPRREAIERMYALFPVLADRRTSRAQTLSGGERQMLAVASALALEPRFVLLDEPTSGMAPKVVETLVEAIVRFRESGASVMWILGENADQAVEHLNSAYVLHAGHIVGELGRHEPVSAKALEEALFGARAPAPGAA